MIVEGDFRPLLVVIGMAGGVKPGAADSMSRTGDPYVGTLSKIWSQVALITECESQYLGLEAMSDEYHPADEDDGSSDGLENAENG